MAPFSYALKIEYDGGAYAGWQRQDRVLTVQEALEQALTQALGESITIWGAGRTDAGVHALGQVAHIRCLAPYTRNRLIRGANFHLKRHKHAIRVLEASPVPPTFHARFSALEREYTYRVLGRESPSPLWQNRAWWVPQPISKDLLELGCSKLQGHHSFHNFRSSVCQGQTPIKTMKSVQWCHQPPFFIFSFTSQSFLHNQIRRMVGALLRVAILKSPLTWLDQLLEPCYWERSVSFTAPPHGLFFKNVLYEPDPFGNTG